MADSPCPEASHLLSWLGCQDDDPKYATLSSHIEYCVACQRFLDEQCNTEEMRLRDCDGGSLIRDLSRTPPVCHLENEAVKILESSGHFNDNNSHVDDRTFTEWDYDSLPATVGTYDITGLLGRGGMGLVYKGHHRELNRPVAIKVLLHQDRHNSQANARFDREMRLIGLLSHKNIVSAYDAGLVDGKRYLVLEYVSGITLQQLIKKDGPLDSQTAMDYVGQAAAGLQYAHVNGVIHRDIKPSNLMVDDNGIVKILDLGLARLKVQDELTLTNVMMGSVDFMAPEQADNSKSADERSDIYSLGCTWYYLLTGQPMFGGESAIQKVLAHREKPVPSVGRMRPDLPPEIDRIIGKMVAKSSKHRFQSMAEVSLAIQQIRATPRRWYLQDSWQRSKRNLVCGIAIGLLLVGLPFVLLVLSGLWKEPDHLNEVQFPAVNGVNEPDGKGIVATTPNQEEYLDLLARIPLTGAWTRTSDGLFQQPVVPNSVIQIPSYIPGSYEIKTSFTRRSGENSVNYYFPVGNRVGIVYLDVSDRTELVMNPFSPKENFGKLVQQSIETGKRYELIIAIKLSGEHVTLLVRLNGESLIEWTGMLQHLPPTSTSGQFAIGSREGDTIFHELLVRPLPTHEAIIAPQK